MSTRFQYADAAARSFSACKGIVMATFAETGEIRKVVAIENASEHVAEMVIRFADGTSKQFRADYDHESGILGTYFEVKIHAPRAPGCEVTKIEILDGGSKDYEVYQHGSGSVGPGLTLTLLNEGAEARNAPIIAAWEAEQSRQHDETQRKNDETAARLKAELAARLKVRQDEIAAMVKGRGVKGVSIEGHSSDHLTSLVLTLDDGTSMKIRARLDHSLEITSPAP